MADGLNKDNCGFAEKGTCRLPAEACAVCKVDKAASDLHRDLVIGSWTWSDIMQQQYEAELRRRKARLSRPRVRRGRGREGAE